MKKRFRQHIDFPLFVWNDFNIVGKILFSPFIGILFIGAIILFPLMKDFYKG